MHKYLTEVDTKKLEQSFIRFLKKNKSFKINEYPKRKKEIEQIKRWASEVIVERDFLELIIEKMLNVGIIDNNIAFEKYNEEYFDDVGKVFKLNTNRYKASIKKPIMD